jgi:hypothetical protein
VRKYVKTPHEPLSITKAFHFEKGTEVNPRQWAKSLGVAHFALFCSCS